MFTSILHIPDSLKPHLQGANTFDTCMRLQGRAFRDVPGRKTMQITLNEKSYFIKQHTGVGWSEIFKNLFSFKLPILGAMTEVAAINKCRIIGLATTQLVAYGQQGCNPASLQSFVMTEDLGDITSIDTLLNEWQISPPSNEIKHHLIIAIANLAAKMHGAGMVHRDFYLCHLAIKNSDLMQNNFYLMVLDLHRVAQNQAANGNMVMKDMAGLLFSGIQCGLTDADWAIFKAYYLPQNDAFWINAQKRANKLFAKFQTDKFQHRLKLQQDKLQ